MYPLSLAPKPGGRSPPKKNAVVRTIQEAAKGLGLPALDPDGSEQLGGHAMRIGGAQSLSEAGFDTWAIALLARLGSSAVLGYVRNAPPVPNADLLQNDHFSVGSDTR